MIKATYLEFGTGREIEVEVLGGDPEAHTATVSPVEWDSNGLWFNNRPRWTVYRSALIEVRVKCQCGTEYDPAGKCPECGLDWREPVSDQQDTEETRAQLGKMFREG